MNAEVWIRLALFIGTLIPVVYSLIFLKKGIRPSYFRCVFYGYIGALLAAAYNLVSAIDAQMNAEMFSLGVFGDVAFFLFITVANYAYIPKEFDEKKQKISVPSVIIACVYLLVWIIPIVLDPTVGNISCCVLYGISSVICLYTCIEILLNKFNNELKQAIAPFILCIITIIASFMIAQIFASTGIELLYIIAAIGVDSIGIIATILSMYLLKKGLEPWEI